MNAIPRARDLIDLALRTPRLRSLAAIHMAKIIGEALAGDSMARTPGMLRGSDNGRCVRELWADIHDKMDLDVDFDTQLTRFDSGHLFACWIASLMAVAIDDTMPDGYTTVLEQVTRHEDMTGHIDVLLRKVERTGLDGNRDWKWMTEHLWEIKTTYGIGKNVKEPALYQRLQAASYALGEGVPTFSIITLAPANYAERFHQFDFVTDDFRTTVSAERVRLRAGLLDEMPEGDPEEKWRCTSCRFTACELNKNPLKFALLEI